MRGEDGVGVPVEFLQERRGLHLLKDVEVVVGGAAVGAEGYVNAAVDEFLIGHCPVYGKFHVGAGVVRDGASASAEEFAVGIVEPAAVCGDGSFGEASAVVEEFCGADSVCLNAVFYLFFGLAEVGVKHYVLFFGEFGAPFESFFRDGVGCVRSDRGFDTRVFHVGDVLIQGFGCLNLGFTFFFAAEIDESVGEDTFYAHFVDGFCRHVHEEVHVVEGDRSRAYHLYAGEFCAPVYVVAGEVRFKGPYFLGEPFLKVHVVGISAEECHCRVSVGV